MSRMADRNVPVLERLRIDAAIAGQVLLVAFTDTFGFFVFLGMAAWFLR